jgi:hypothetical protein
MKIVKKSILVGILALIFCGCGHEKADVLSEYKDWYVLKVPESEPIQAVYGDIDGRLIVATLFKIYLTDDRGKTWRKPNYPPNTNYSLGRGLVGILFTNDTLMALDTRRLIKEDTVTYGSDPIYFSTDNGENWKFFLNSLRVRVPLNVLKTPSGTVYSINEVFIPIRNSTTSFYAEGFGVKVSDGRVLDLPQKHQIKSIYFDKKRRLYICGSAAVCGKFEDFRFCDGQNGMLYVSKEPQP